MLKRENIQRNIKLLRESSNPKRLVFETFRRSFAKNNNVETSINTVAYAFALDRKKVISIVSEGIKARKKLNEFEMKPTVPSKRDMFKGKSQEELHKELTNVKRKMKAHEDRGVEVPEELRSKFSELTFALRAKHDWGKV